MWTKNQGTMRFGYDGFGRRVRVDDAGTEKRFIYDGAHVFMELDVSGSISIVAEYTYYPGMDRPHSVRRGGATGSTYYYAVDYPGNVVGLIDGNDDLAARYRYAPFGEAELATGSLAQANPLRFAAREYDATSGLYYMRARYYDPEVGRFISEDPLGLEAGINPYLYVDNNPMRGRDPTGLSPSYGTGELVGTIWDAFSRYQLTRWTIVFGRNGRFSFGRGWTAPWRTTYMPTSIFNSRKSMRYLVYHEGYHVKQRDDWGFLAYSGRGVWNQMLKGLSTLGRAADPYKGWERPVRSFSDLSMEAQAEVWGQCWGFKLREACDVLKKLGEDIPEEMEN